MGLVIGEISYTNMLPLYYYLDRDYLNRIGCMFIPQIPAQLNEAMSKGAIDVGGISSFSYGEHVDQYTLLPNLSVSAPKNVGSIFLFSKVPITQLDGKKVALTSSSATSVNLLKIILQTFYQMDVSYTVMKPDFNEMLKDHDACLLIGDDAIVTLWGLSPDFHRYDLGQIWYEHTKLPMTFAVLAVRNEILERENERISILYDGFMTSKNKCLENNYSEMISSIRKDLSGSKTYWENYFQGLNHDLTDKHIEGLYLFYDKATELGLLKKVNKISLWSALDHCHSI
ncbi:menaquinone biosynthesis protein [Anaerobacillus sp. CMMVII]|uniref:menaquinone biosynthesis protein n=1 Tax=Anaerobacillus sp. CMMVII TaxID=2755588 RepID=UPI0021B822B1|nr:menaquinone biosynthesis protein [Anaerobacillus sp. CMMVII]MCT8138891.1 menaquinone biosynthesis protein [Anaerobacillus sp. CMMVII]